MLRNYLKIAYRNLVRHKADALINIVGLCVAFTSALLLFLSVYYEWSFDQFHHNAKDIYHVLLSVNNPQKVENSNSTPVPLLPALKASYPEIKYGARFINREAVVSYGSKKLTLNLKLTDPDFLLMFTFPLLKGNPTATLNNLHDIILREETAKAIFNDEDPMGKIIQVNMDGNFEPFNVTGIIANNPENSSIKYDLIARFENSPNYAVNVNKWDDWTHDVYLQLLPGTNITEFKNKMTPFLESHFREDITHLKRDGAKPSADGGYMHIGLQPFLSVHTDTSTSSEGNSISGNYLYLLLAIGILIMVIASINFINLSIGRSFTRSREIGLRKTLGAQRAQLAIQFWSEAFLLCLIAFVISCVLCYLLMPAYKQMFAMNINRQVLFSPFTWLGIFLFFLIVTLLAGGYPSWIMAKYNIIQILKGKLSVKNSHTLRNSLIIIQFSIAVLLMICTIISWQQINYLRRAPLGYNRSQVISIPVEGDVQPSSALQLMRKKLAGSANIESITGIYDNLGRGLDNSSRTSIEGFDYNNKELKSVWMGVSYDFVKTLDLQVLEGRDFSREFPTDSNALVINEEMAMQLGDKNIIGSLIPVHDSQPPMKVIGIVKNFHFQSLQNKITPLSLVMERGFGIHYILVKVKPTDLAVSLELLKNTWKQIAPNNEFKGSLLNENIERQYRREEKLGQIFISGAIIAITLSCMGLLAIVLLIVTQRTKEIGIRKVLGSSVSGIITLISKDFLKLVIISCFIAFPIAWFGMHTWLEDFSYRIKIGWWVFVLGGVGAIIIALLTVSLQTLKAALSNPVKSLRTE